MLRAIPIVLGLTLLAFGGGIPLQTGTGVAAFWPAVGEVAKLEKVNAQIRARNERTGADHPHAGCAEASARTARRLRPI